MKLIASQLVYPNPILLLGLILLMLFDLLTGVNKAARAGNATTSRGLRNTFDKGSTYLMFILSLIVIVNIMSISNTNDEFTRTLTYVLSAVVTGACYIEFKSIIENLIAINTDADGNKTDFATYILCPVHNILILKLQKKEITKTT